MKDGNVTIPLYQAILWYFGDSKELQQLALRAFDREQLESSLEYIMKLSAMQDNFIKVPRRNQSWFESLASLQYVANYLNGKWQKIDDVDGYYIGSINEDNIVSYPNLGIGISVHQSYTSPYIVYFRTVENAKRAISILGEKVIKNLFQRKI